MDILEIKSALLNGGVVGAGGAGFPTYAKLSKEADTVILNCAECEPLIKVDRQLLTNYTDEILAGMKLIVDALDAKEGIIAVKKSYVSAIEAVETVIDHYDKLQLQILPDIYPAGDEVVLIYETMGKIVPQGKIPIEVGCVVINVETVLNTYYKIHEDKNVTTKFVTVAGEVYKPFTADVPIGITVKELIELAGGRKIEDSALVMGGPMTGTLTSMNDIVTKTTKAVLVLPPNSVPIQKRRTNIKFNLRNAMSVCSQCQMCTSLCPRALLGQSIKPHEFMRVVSSGMTENVEPFLNTMYCCSCGLCEMYSCHQSLSPRRLIETYKSGLRANGIKATDKAGKPDADIFREERRIPEHRLIHRLGLHTYDYPAPMVSYEGKTKEVKLFLRQSVGAPVTPKVFVGDMVTKGQIIGEPPAEALGVCLHASLNGKVTAVTKNFITIKSNEAN